MILSLNLVGMEGYEITTAHNVKLKFGYASLGDRVLAYLLDSLIKGGYILVIAFIGVMTSRLNIFKDSGFIFALVAIALVLAPLFYYLRNDFTTARFILLIIPMVLLLIRFRIISMSTPFWVIVGIIGISPIIGYSLFFEYFMAGQTPGKRVLKIKVTSADSSELTFGKCLVRWLFRLVDFGAFSGVIAMVVVAVTDKKQRVGDLVAGTIVVSMKSSKTLDETIYAYVDSERKARYPLAAQLTAREVEIVKEVLRLYDQENKYELVPMTAAKLRAAVGAGPELDDLSLLKAIVEDYYTLAAQ